MFVSGFVRPYIYESDNVNVDFLHVFYYYFQFVGVESVDAVDTDADVVFASGQSYRILEKNIYLLLVLKMIGVLGVMLVGVS